LYTGYTPGTGEKLRLTSDMECLKSMRWNDKAVSVLVERDDNNYNNNGGGDYQNNVPQSWKDRNMVVAVFMNSGYGGDRLDYVTGSYNLSGKSFDRNISSIYVKPGFSITVYDQLLKRGNRRTIYNDINNLNDIGWNDRIRSFEIRRN
jgi:hypothetical protein